MKVVFNNFVGFGKHISIDIKCRVLDDHGREEKFFAVARNITIEKGIISVPDAYDEVVEVVDQLLLDLVRLTEREEYFALCEFVATYRLSLLRMKETAPSGPERFHGCLILLSWMNNERYSYEKFSL
jgi:hypothetical protein